MRPRRRREREKRNGKRVGSVWRTVVGVLFLALITNGTDLLAIDPFYQPIVQGVVIVAAVAVSSLAASE